MSHILQFMAINICCFGPYKKSLRKIKQLLSKGTNNKHRKPSCDEPQIILRKVWEACLCKRSLKSDSIFESCAASACQFSKRECERAQQLIYRKLFISYGKSREKEREEKWGRRSSERKKHECTAGPRPPTCRGRGARGAQAAGVETVTFI